MRNRKHARRVRARDVAVVLGLHRAAIVGLDATALSDPGVANARQAACDIDAGLGIGVGPRWIVDAEAGSAVSVNAISRNGTLTSACPSGEEYTFDEALIGPVVTFGGVRSALRVCLFMTCLLVRLLV